MGAGRSACPKEGAGNLSERFLANNARHAQWQKSHRHAQWHPENGTVSGEKRPPRAVAEKPPPRAVAKAAAIKEELCHSIYQCSSV
jgi:hypothetical protein